MGRTGTPFFYLGDTAWELFHRLDREEADEYLSLRAAQGFHVIQAAALAELACRPLRLVHKMLVRPAQMRLQAAQSRRRACRKAKKSAKIKKSAEKRLQKPSKVLYN